MTLLAVLAYCVLGGAVGGIFGIIMAGLTLLCDGD